MASGRVAARLATRAGFRACRWAFVTRSRARFVALTCRLSRAALVRWTCCDRRAWRASRVSVTMTIHGSQEPTTEAAMDKFLVLYRAPNSVVDEWMKKPEQERKPEETKMMDGWKKWM